jgi:hypothetical protein
MQSLNDRAIKKPRAGLVIFRNFLAFTKGRLEEGVSIFNLFKGM